MKKILSSSLVLLILISSLSACNTNAPYNETQKQAPFQYRGVEGVDALTLLKQQFQVQTKDFGPGMGEFVESIQNIKPGKDEFWAFYINGSSSNVGASSYQTKADDTLEWKLEKITDTY